MTSELKTADEEMRQLAKEQKSAGVSSRDLTATADVLSAEELRLMDGYFRASNYLTVGQIYLRDNVLLQEPLKPEHIKPRLLGHWGTSPGLNLLWVHMNRLIRKNPDLDAITLIGPGHGGPAMVAQVWLEGTWTEVYPEVTQDKKGMLRLFRQFSTPGGIPSHCSPEVPGSIHEGGELGYVLSHAFGAVFDNPDLVALAIVGDGEAETGPLEGSWKSISFLNPVHDGAVLPVLHLNGYKIASTTVMGRESDEFIRMQISGYGYEVLFVEGDDPAKVHQLLAKTMDYALQKIRSIQKEARQAGQCLVRPQWPCIILRTPKGWTGPKVVDGKKVEGTFRAHQVPLAGVRENKEHFKQLEEWMRSYKPEELFDENGKLKQEYAQLAPKGEKRMSAQPYTNGGKNVKPLKIPDIRQYALKVDKPAEGKRASSVLQLGQLCRDIYKENPTSFRLFCPDEANSNRLGAVFETEKRCLMLPTLDSDDALGPGGRVMEVLSEHLCNGWLEGYTITGRHGMIATYEAFALIFNSMTMQTIKWLEVVDRHLPWRRSLPSVNILLTSTCWRNDHNGFSHQGPGFIDTLLTKQGNVVRTLFPCDANTLLVTMKECFESMDKVNCICIDKQPHLQFLNLEEATKHHKAGISEWKWASNLKEGQQPDFILACCGDVMTQEALAAAAVLREHAPDFAFRFVNVLDLMRMYAPQHHPHGMPQEEFEKLFGKEEDVVFAYHSYPSSLHQLLHNRAKPERFHVRGYTENGTTTTPFQMVCLNNVSRYHLVKLALRYGKNAPNNKDELAKMCDDKLKHHEQYARENLEDPEEIGNWKWSF